MSMLDLEVATLKGVFQVCPCCVIPCCNYCVVQAIWTVTGAATKTVGTTVEQVNFDFSLDMTFNRDDDRHAPLDPKTFRVSEGVGLDEQPCELLNNGGIQDGAFDGSYLYTMKISGVEVDRESANLNASISSVHGRLDCDNASWPYAGTTHPTTGAYVPTTTLSMYADGEYTGTSGTGSTLGSPNSMPTDWRSLFSINNKQFDNVAESGGVGTETVNDSSGAPTGWDSGSLSDISTINVTRCEDV
jgi:hypothetical protein